VQELVARDHVLPGRGERSDTAQSERVYEKPV
jgi:hypothetical protein